METAVLNDDIRTLMRTASRHGPFRGARPVAGATGPGADGVRAGSRVVDLGALHVSTVAFPPVRGHGAPKLLWQPAPETYHVALPLYGGTRVSQAGRETVFGTDSLYLHDTSQPYAVRAAGGEGAVVVLGAHVPKALLPIPADRMEALAGGCVPARDGVGALFADFLTRLAADSGPYRPGDTPRLGDALLALLTAVFGHELDAEDGAPPATPQQDLTVRIQDFIERHLDDPCLTPGVIASAHHISSSYLHRLFQDEGVTVGTWIRRQRLDRCRRDLSDRTKRATPIHVIAARWGFPHAAGFSRAFRCAYGLTPKEFRHRAALAWHGPSVKEMSTPG